MTLWEFHLRQKGHSRIQEEEYNRVRILASILIQPHLKKGKRIKPSDIFELPSDRVRTKPLPTKEQYEQFIDEIWQTTNTSKSSSVPTLERLKNHLAKQRSESTISETK